MNNFIKQKTIAIIPARGGSKRLPGKNIKLLNGKPLIWYAIRDAKESKCIDDFFVSTDNREIAETAEQYGAKIINRPPKLATDIATTDSVVKHAVEYLKFNGNVVILQPTAPLRTAKDIEVCADKFFQNEPSILVTIGPRGSYTGSVYIFNTKDFAEADYCWKELTYKNPYVFMMDKYHEAANVDYLEDFLAAERFLKGGLSVADFSFADHLSKEIQFADRIGDLHFYMSERDGLDNLRHKDEVLYKKLRDNPERVRLLSEIAHGKNCLDVGCSDGLITLEIAKRSGSQVLGIDIREEAIDNARRLAGSFSDDVRQRVEFAVLKPEELVAAGRKFDTMYFTEVLEHIDYRHHSQTIENLVKLMHSGSNLIISIPNRYPAQHYEQEGRHRWDAPAHLAHFSKLSFEDLLKGYFREVNFITLTQDKRPQDGIWLICDCKL